MSTKLVAEYPDVTVYEGEGGGYYSWSPSKLPLLAETKLGAGKLHLHPFGFALPHFSDSSKLAYVLEGKCTVGLVTPNSSQEIVVVIKKGDVLPLLRGVVSWWFNSGDNDTTIIFLGETTKAQVPGDFSYFFMTGILGFLNGFQSDFVEKIFDLDNNQVKDILTSQQGALIVKLKNGTVFPSPSVHRKVYAPIDTTSADVVVKGGGIINSLTEKDFSVLVKMGLSATFVRLEGKAIFSPSYAADGSVRAVYVAKGSGQIRVVANEGKPSFDGEVVEGELLILPQFSAASVLANEGGIELFSVITSSKPIFEQLAGNDSVWKALSHEVLQSALNISPELEKLFKKKNENVLAIIPPRS
ncbi:11-S seed storage protein [Artemisia annua]|uniref:11-S seed storage protein n=1 Tax=Artemisia annua TaxID=35608 RepID=A0A2U1KM33_ARTAN|nr:11-S seed storage protein [Artemisia annua]